MALSITPAELKNRMDSSLGVFILDVRSNDAYKEWRIKGAKVESINIQNSKLKEFGIESFSEIPKNREIVAVCAKGISAKETVTMLKERGYQAVFLSGGMGAWSEFYATATVVQNENLAIYQMIRPAKGCLSYIIVSGNEVAVIDAGRHVHHYIDFAKDSGLSIRFVFDTHLHADHISGGRELARATGAEYWISPAETNGSVLEGRDDINSDVKNHSFYFGESNVKITSLHTPGHTIGSTSFLVNDTYLLSGDTLFVSGLGRSDLKGRAKEMAAMMFDTVQTKIAELPNQILILPGHFSDYREVNTHGFVGETLGEIRTKNSLLYMQNKDEFVEVATSKVGKTPPNYETVTAINRGIKDVSLEEKAELEIGPNRCAIGNYSEQ